MKLYTAKPLYFFSLFVNLMLPILVFGVFEGYFFNIYYNSDTLYLASVYKDVFVDGTGLRGWNLNGAPNFFPDMFLYSVIRFFSGDFRLAYVIFSTVQYNLLVFLIGSLFKGINPKINPNYITLFYFLFPVFLLATILHGSFQFTFDIMSQSYHNGCFINTLIALNFLFRYLTREKRAYLIAMLVFVFLGAFNDRLFLVTFVAPVFAVLVFNLIWLKRKALNKAGIWIIGTSLFSMIVFNLTKKNAIYQCIGLGEKFMNFGNAGPSFNNLLAQLTNFVESIDLRGLIVILTLLSFVVLVFLFFRLAVKSSWFKRMGAEDEIATIFILFSSVSVFITLFTPVINGYYLGPSCIRYTMVSFYLSMFNVVFIVYFFTRGNLGKPWLTITLAVLSIFYAGMIVHTFQSKPVAENLKAVINYYPDKVKQIDDFAGKHQIQYGVAGYWDAKYTTMFSKHNVRVYTAINEKLNLWYHVMNSNWYYNSEKGKFKDPEFRFVILSPEDFKTTREIFGEPIDSAQVEQNKFIYYIPEFKYNSETRQPYSLE